MLGYSAASGVKWCILSNGDRYRVYNALAELPLEKKLFISIDISDVNRREASFQELVLLSKKSLEEQGLDLLWRDHERGLRSTEDPASGQSNTRSNVAKIDGLCLEYKEIQSEIEKLTEKKNALKDEILELMSAEKISTAHFNLTRYSVVQVKTSLDSARALGCVVTKEQIDKAALKRLHEEGVPVPDVQVSTALRITGM